MVGELAGDQWNEGDVSCSVVRRVALPDAFFAVDGLFQTLLTVLDEFGAYPAVIARELDRYLPFLATTKILVARGAAGRRPRGRPRGDQGARGRGGAGHAGEGRRRQRPVRPARRRRPPGPEPRRDRRARGRPGGLCRRRLRPGPGGGRPRRRGGRAASRRRPRTPRRRSSDPRRAPGQSSKRCSGKLASSRLLAACMPQSRSARSAGSAASMSGNWAWNGVFLMAAPMYRAPT